MTIGMKKLSSKTLKKVYNRHYQLLGCFNYERQMSTGYAWTMMPAIRELYGEDEGRRQTPPGILQLRDHTESIYHRDHLRDGGTVRQRPGRRI